MGHPVGARAGSFLLRLKTDVTGAQGAGGTLCPAGLLLPPPQAELSPEQPLPLWRSCRNPLRFTKTAGFTQQSAFLRICWR